MTKNVIPVRTAEISRKAIDVSILGFLLLIITSLTTSENTESCGCSESRSPIEGEKRCSSINTGIGEEDDREARDREAKDKGSRSTTVLQIESPTSFSH
jgi:hypothetical protein